MSHAQTDLERAMLVMDKLARQNETLKRARNEPIAIVGIGLRFPGGCRDPQSFWDFLERGGDGITSIGERWALCGVGQPADTPRWAGLLEGIDTFDAEFFGISPREAQKLDPQHRLLLEVSWEALEDAGILPQSLNGSKTGVFLGACATDYIDVMDQAAPGHTDAYSTTGNMNSVAAGRLSYTLALNGPAVTVDTACSSSLVSTHLACLGLRNKECDLALAGGVNVILSPRTMVGLARSQALSPDGRCYTFDARANGYARGEGCGIVVLKRLSDAERDGDRIWAVIKATAINQDGRSTGLTAPNVLSQQALLKEALGRARLKPEDIGYVESHGTGTSLGDPIEVDALRAVLGTPRDDGSRCRIGALKTSIGHLEGSAGVAGLIKAALVLAHGRIPRNLNFRTLNPRIALDGTALELATRPVDWPRSDRARHAGVSSFGFSGTNAHVILGESPEAPPTEASPTSPRSARLVVVSGHTAEALDAQVQRLAVHLDAHPEQSVADIAYSLATGRTAFAHRASFVAESRKDLQVALSQGARGGMRGEARAERGRTAWLFTGQGAQTLGMGRRLHAEWPVFRDALDRCAALLDPHLDRPLLEVMWSEPALLDETRYTQPALFAVELALAELWRSFGVQPELVAGHSIGEISAATVAGALSLEDAARLVAARGRLMGSLPPGGAMCSIRATEGEVEEAVAGEPLVAVAAVNAPGQVVISGDEARVADVAEAFALRGAQVKRLTVSHAFHSPLMDPILDEFRRVADSVRFQEARIPVVSNLTGALAGPELATPAYWVDHLRRAVRFNDGLWALHQAGARTFVELGPQPTLTAFARARLQQESPVLLASLRKGRNETATMLAALGGWFAGGGSVDWKGVFAEERRRVDLPRVAFQRRRHWIAASAPAAERATVAADQDGRWLLAGSRLPLPGKAEHRVVRVGRAHQPYLDDHRIFGRIVVPGAFWLSTMLAMASARWPESALTLEDVEFLRALDFDDEADVAVHAVVTPDEEGATVELSSEQDAGGSRTWVLHARCRARAVARPVPKLRPDHLVVDRAVDVEAFYNELTAMHITWGPSWRWIASARAGEGCSVGRVEPRLDAIEAVAPLHPVLIDNALGGGMMHAMGIGGDRTPRLPTGVERLTWFRPHAGAVDSAGVARDTGETIRADLLFSDPDGQPLLEIEGLMARRAPRELLLRATSEAQAGRKRRFEMDWNELDAVDEGQPKAGRWLVLGEPGAPVDELAALVANGERDVEPFVFDRDLDGLDPSAVRVLFESAAAEAGAAFMDLAGVVCLWRGADTKDEAAAAHRLTAEALHVLQAAEAALGETPVWWVTSGAVSPGACLPSQASIWGLGRAWQQEQARTPLFLVDLEAGATDATALVVRELGTHDREPQVRLGRGRREGARLVRAEPPGVPLPERLLGEPGSVLVTGGCGALGLHAARWLADRGVAHIVLTDRVGPESAEVRRALDDLAARGASVQVAVADVADRAAMAAVLAALPDRYPLRGVVHAAGVNDDGFATAQSRDRLDRVLGPKVDGAWILHELTLDRALDFFVLYSSAASVLGSAGQSTYSAANAFLDGLARARRGAGLSALSIQWGPWAGGGMEARLDEAIRARLLRWGMTLLTPEQGLLHLGEALAEGATELMVAAFDVGAARQAKVPPVLLRLVPSAVAWAGTSKKSTDLAAQLIRVPEPERRAIVLDAVRSDIAETLAAASVASIPPGALLRDLGLDSLMAVELQAALSQRVGKDLPATLALDFPTAESIADYLLEQVLDLREAEEKAAVEVPRVRAADEPIAVIGMGCRLPGGVTDPESYWRLLEEGRDAVTEIPAERWDAADWYDPDPKAPGKMNTRWGGFLQDIDKFDARFFDMEDREAVCIDPQQRVLMEVTWEALERAGITPERLSGSPTGVYVGITGNDYQHHAVADVRTINPYSLMGSAHSAIAGRIAFWLGVRGPTFPVDTACSSSLVAVHLACQGLRSGECDMALAGGVNLVIRPEGSVWFSKLKVMSPTGKTRSFSAEADGFVRSEGCGVVVLKRLRDAQADGDTVLAVIRGTAVNHDGRSASFVVPNATAQQEVVRRALAQAGVRPQEVAYVECQGTATPLGDTIEAQALASTMLPGRDPAHPLLIGSVKSNLGHTESASGVAGLIKTILALQHGRIPASLHCATPNPRLPWDALPMRVVNDLRDWPQGARIAGVSAFGITGTNAHAVVGLPERPAPVVASETEEGPRLFVLSGRTPAALEAFAARLARWEGSLGDLAWTLAAHRAHFEHRLAFVATDVGALRATLAQVAAGGLPPGAHRAAPGDDRSTTLVLGDGHLDVRDDTWPAFREAVMACDDAMPGVLESAAGAAFAARFAMIALWRAFGCRPDRVVAHGPGLVAAAAAAGAVSLRDALRHVTGAEPDLDLGGFDAVETPAGVVARVAGSDPVGVLSAVGGWYVQGGAVHWAAVVPPGRRVLLPAYPWQRQRYWLELRR